MERRKPRSGGRESQWPPPFAREGYDERETAPEVCSWASEPRKNRLGFDPSILSRSGGIGRRSGFKIRRPQGCTGSSPVFGTEPGRLRGGLAWLAGLPFGGCDAQLSEALDAAAAWWGLNQRLGPSVIESRCSARARSSPCRRPDPHRVAVDRGTGCGERETFSKMWSFSSGPCPKCRTDEQTLPRQARLVVTFTV